MSVVGWQVNVCFFLCYLYLVLKNMTGIGKSGFESKETFLFSSLLYFRFADFLFYFLKQFCYFIHFLLVVIQFGDLDNIVLLFSWFRIKRYY